MMSVCVYKDYKSGLWANPFFTAIEHDHICENIILSMHNAKEDERQLMIDLEAYYLGEFDEHTGKFTLLAEPEFLISMNDLLGGSSNGKEDN